MKLKPDELEHFINSGCENFSITREEFIKLVSYKKVKDIVVLDTVQTTKNMNKYATSIGRKDLINDHPTMTMLSLEGEALELWKDMVRTQPIMI